MITEKIIKQASKILRNHNIPSHELDAPITSFKHYESKKRISHYK